MEPLPTLIKERFSKNSSNEEIFNELQTDYENTLKGSGFQLTNFRYKKTAEKHKKKTKKKTKKNKTNRRRNIIWFNQPFNKNIRTNGF